MYSYFKLTAQVSAYTMTYSKIDPPPDPPPDPPVASFSNDLFAAFEAVMAIYMPMLDVYNFFRGSTYAALCLLATIFASIIAPRLP